jgi:drug/metabolite transporter (DMT)-like permease
VTLLSAVFLKMKLDRVVGASLTLVLGGCCLVFYDAFMKEADPTGLLYATGAMCFFSFYILMVQVLLGDLKPLTATFYVMLFAAVSFNLSGDVGAWLNLTAPKIAMGATLGLVPGVIAVAFLYMAVEKIGSAYASIFSSIEPVVTVAGAVLFLDENVVLLQVVGAALIVVGIVTPNLRTLHLKRKAAEQGIPLT